MNAYLSSLGPTVHVPGHRNIIMSNEAMVELARQCIETVKQNTETKQ